MPCVCVCVCIHIFTRYFGEEICLRANLNDFCRGYIIIFIVKLLITLQYVKETIIIIYYTHPKIENLMGFSDIVKGWTGMRFYFFILYTHRVVSLRDRKTFFLHILWFINPRICKCNVKFYYILKLITI